MTETVLFGSLLLAIPIAMLAGLVSFASPCVLPLAPGYLAYVTSLTGADLGAAAPITQPVPARVSVPEREPPSSPSPPVGSGNAPPQPPPRGRVVLGAVLFVTGFSAVFVSYGLLFGGVGSWLLAHQRTIGVVLGAVVVVLGLAFAGVPGLSSAMWFNRERRPGYRPARGLWGAPVLGVVFGLGWTPCIGPTLAAVQTLAFTEASAARGAALSLAYCVGLGLPFVLIAWGVRWSAGLLSWTRQHHRAISTAGGVMLVAVGVLLMTGVWSQIVVWLQSLTPGFSVVV